MSDLSDVLAKIDTRLVALRFGEIQREGKQWRLLLTSNRIWNWLFAVLERSDWPPDVLEAHLQQFPRNKRWWAVRQLLPDSALLKLDALLQKELEAANEKS